MLGRRILFIFIISALIISGCAKKKPELESSLRGKCFEGAPKWVINPEIAGELSAVGSAKVGKAGIQFAKTEATALARERESRKCLFTISSSDSKDVRLCTLFHLLSNLR